MSASLPLAVDALVVGGGPAGLSAATWLGRYQRSTLVVDTGQHRNRFADRVHGLMGRDPIAPQTLLAEARAGLEQYPQVTVRDGTVEALQRGEDGRFRATVDGAEVTADRVVLATGVKDQFPAVAGFKEHYGTDVHHCPACDGYTVRGRSVIVLGAGDHVPAYAAELLDWAQTVRVVTDTAGQAFDDGQRVVLAGHGVEVIDGVAETLVGPAGALEGLRLAEGTFVEGDAVFFSYAHHPVNAMAADLGCAFDDHGRVLVDGYQLTSINGLYAAGDITPGFQLVSTALGQGAVAGVACATSLRGHETVGSGPEPAPPARRFTTG